MTAKQMLIPGPAILSNPKILILFYKIQTSNSLCNSHVAFLSHRNCTFFLIYYSHFLNLSFNSQLQLSFISSEFSKMDDQITADNVGSNHNSHSESKVLDIYPLSCYYFGSKEATQLKNETIYDRVLRMKANYDAYGMRNCVAAVIVVELFKHPHLLLLQINNSIFKLPGGRLRPSESNIDCLKRKLSSKLSVGEDGRGPEWEVGECLGMWWKPDFETLLYPYLPPNIKRPKECTKLFLVKLPPSRRFVVPKNYKLLAVPLCQIHENHKAYGPIISGVPQLLSRFSFNIVES